MEDEKENTADDLNGLQAGEELARRAVELLIALNAATINIHMYPPTSDMISASVETAFARMDPLLAETGKLTLGEADNMLLINGERLHERDQIRPPVLSFLDSLRKRDVYSITLSKGMGGEEFTNFLEIMARDPEELRQQGGLAMEVDRQGCSHILVNEKRFVSVADDQVISTEGGGDTGAVEETRFKEEELLHLNEKLKDERFVNYIVGSEERDTVGEDTLNDIMGNPPRLGLLLRQAVREIVVELEDPDEALDKICDTLERIALLLKELEDAELKAMDSEEIAKAAAFLEPSELKGYLLREKPEALRELELREKILQSLRENKTLDLLESVIREHDSLQRQETDLSPEEEGRFQALSALIDEIYQNSVGKPWESRISDRIFQADMWKKIVNGKGEGGSAGSSGLVYQISSLLVNEGLTFDIDELSRNLTIDENIPRLLQKLQRAKRPEIVLRLVEGLLDNLEDMSPEIRLKTAETLRNIPEALEMTRQLQEFPMAYEMKDRMLERLERERELSEIYATLSGCLAGLAQTFILSQDYDSALEIIDTFWRHNSSDETRKPEQRRAALEAISSIASGPVLDDLAEILKEGDIQTITEVANIMIKFEEKSVQPLIRVLKDSEDLLVRRVTFEALENIGKDAILSLINDLEKYNPWHMYRNIISILAEIGNRSIIQSLSRFIRHQNPEVRRETIKAISKIKTPETTALLLEALNDRDEKVQREACVGLGRMRDVSTAPVLMDVIRPPRSFKKERRRTNSVKAAALWALGEIGDFSAVPYCRDILRKRSWIPLLDKRKDELRSMAAFALGSIGNDECREVLQQFVDDRSEKVRRTCLESLRRIQRRKTIKTVEESYDMADGAKQ